MTTFPVAIASFFCSTQSSRCQMVQIVGTAGWMRAEVPFAHPPDLSARLLIGSNVAPGTEPEEIVRFDPVNQSGYRLQPAERFGRQIRGAAPCSLADRDRGRGTCGSSDALRRSGESGRWEPVPDADLRPPDPAPRTSHPASPGTARPCAWASPAPGTASLCPDFTGAPGTA